MTFSRTDVPSFAYNIGNNVVERVDSFKDLGVLMDPKLSFNLHINKIINKASRTLGLIKRWAKEFKDPYATKLLYTSVVRPILEYASPVWCPRYQSHIDSIESVQKQFLLFCLRHLGWDPNLPLPCYRSRLKLIDLPTLHSRRTMLNVSFVFNLLNGDVRCDFLLHKLSFSVPTRPSRYFSFFKLEYFTLNYLNFNPFRAALVDFNNHYKNLNLNMSIFSVKKNCLKSS